VDVAELLGANLQRVFGNRDATSRRAAIDELFTDDARFEDHDGVSVGRDALEERVVALQARMPADAAFGEDGPRYAEGDHGAVAWFVGAAEAPAVRGIDLIVVRDGRIAELRVLLAAG
jgi:hypothetical protein